MWAASARLHANSRLLSKLQSFLFVQLLLLKLSWFQSDGETEATLRRKTSAQSMKKISFVVFSHSSFVLNVLNAKGIFEFTKNKSHSNSWGQDVETLRSKFVCIPNNFLKIKNCRVRASRIPLHCDANIVKRSPAWITYLRWHHKGKLWISRRAWERIKGGEGLKGPKCCIVDLGITKTILYCIVLHYNNYNSPSANFSVVEF